MKANPWEKVEMSWEKPKNLFNFWPIRVTVAKRNTFFGLILIRFIAEKRSFCIIIQVLIIYFHIFWDFPQLHLLT